MAEKADLFCQAESRLLLPFRLLLEVVLITSDRKGRPFLPSWIKAVTAIPFTCWGEGWIRLIHVLCFQPLMVISPTALVGFSGVCRCMHGDLMWTCLAWAQRSTPDNFWVLSHRFNSATGEQKGITQTIYADSEPPSRMPNSLMPNAKLRSANLPSFMSLVWRGQGSNPDLPHPGCSNHYATRRRSVYLLVCHPGSVGGWIDWEAFWIICNIALGADMYRPQFFLFLKFLPPEYEPLFLSLICNSYQIIIFWWNIQHTVKFWWKKFPNFRYNLSAFIRGWQLVAVGVTHIKCRQKPSLGNHGTKSREAGAEFRQPGGFTRRPCIQVQGGRKQNRATRRLHGSPDNHRTKSRAAGT